MVFHLIFCQIGSYRPAANALHNTRQCFCKFKAMFSVRTPSYKLNANMSFIVLKVPVCICEGGVYVGGWCVRPTPTFGEHKKTFALLSRAHMG